MPTLIGATIIGALLACLTLLFWSKSPRFIAAWQLIGGALILFALVAGILQGYPAIAHPFAVLTSLTVTGFAATAGLLLWRGVKLGVTLSIAAQALQIAWVSVPSAQFGATLGPTFGIRITDATISLNMGFYGRGGLLIIPGHRFPLDITVNVLALLAIVGLLQYRKHRLSRDAAGVQQWNLESSVAPD